VVKVPLEYHCTFSDVESEQDGDRLCAGEREEVHALPWRLEGAIVECEQDIGFKNISARWRREQTACW